MKKNLLLLLIIISTHLVAQDLPKSMWSIKSFNTQETSGEGASNGRAACIIDGDIATYWHSQWSGASIAPPYEIQIDLGDSASMTALKMWPRQNTAAGGKMVNYEIFVCKDGVNWGAAAASGSLTWTACNDIAFKTIPLVAKGRYIKIRHLSTWGPSCNSINIGSMAEVSITGAYLRQMDDSKTTVTTSAASTEVTKPSSINQALLMLNVKADGVGTARTTSFKLNFSKTTNLNDIQKISVYSTDKRTTFDALKLVGSTTNITQFPTIASNTAYSMGDNYFWVTFDLKSTAVIGNIIAATVDTVLVGTVEIKSSVVGFLSGRQIIGTTITNFPQTLQLYRRDKATNKGLVPITGNVTDPQQNTQAVKVAVYRDNVLTDSVINTLTYTAGVANFNCSYSIPAELHNYKFVLSNKIADKYYPFLVADSVVAGDAILITGQSNAEADWVMGYSATDTLRNVIRFQRPFTRVWGSPIKTGAYPKKWYLGIGGNQNVNGQAGQWGLYLASQIEDIHKIPIAVFNGAIGGTAISYHQKSISNPTDIATCYGRLLTRLTETDLKQGVRAFFWYQGEQDATNKLNIQSYINSFKTLYNSWKVDCPNIEKTYLIQIKIGCGQTALNTNYIQEAQRRLKTEIPNIRIFNGQQIGNCWDNCHYIPIGYVKVGRMLQPWVLKDLYGNANDTTDMINPEIKSIKYAGANKLIIETSAANGMTWTAGAQADFSIGQLSGSGVTVTSGAAVGNNIELTLNANLTGSDTLSYWGHDCGSIAGITNKKGLNIQFFGKYLIAKADQIITFSTLNKSIVGDADIILGATSTSTLPITYSSSNPNIATITGNILQIKGVGKCSITATQSGNAFYLPSSVNQELTVEAASAVVLPSTLKGIEVYPNPAKDEFTVKMAENGSMSIQLFDQTGKTVFVKQYPSANALIDVRHFQSGNYILKMFCSKREASVKICIASNK